MSKKSKAITHERDVANDKKRAQPGKQKRGAIALARTASAAAKAKAAAAPKGSTK